MRHVNLESAQPELPPEPMKRNRGGEWSKMLWTFIRKTLSKHQGLRLLFWVVLPNRVTDMKKSVFFTENSVLADPARWEIKGGWILHLGAAPFPDLVLPDFPPIGKAEIHFGGLSIRKNRL